MKIDFDLEGFNALPDVRCLLDGDLACFLVRGHGVANVRVDADGLLHLEPERSAAHRALIAALAPTEAGAAAAERAGMAQADRATARAAMAGRSPA